MTEQSLKLLRVGEVADKLRVSKISVFRLLESGRLPGYKIPCAGWRVRYEELDLFVQRHRGGNGKR